MPCLRSVRVERIGQPNPELHFFAIFCPNQVGLSAQQTFGCGQADEIFGRFDFTLEVLVLRLDVIDCFLRGVGLPIANEGRIGCGNVIEQILDRFVQRFRGKRWSSRHD